MKTAEWTMVEGRGEIPSYVTEASTLQFDGRSVECPDCGRTAYAFRPIRKDGELVGWTTSCPECRAALTIYND